MTAREWQPWKPAGRLHGGLIGLVVALLLLGGLSACAGHKVPTEEPSSSAAPEVSSPPASVAPGATLVDLKGTGNKTSEDFSASGDSVDVSYSYTCTEPASFTLNFYGANVSPELPDVITDEFGASRSDTATEPLNGATGPFHVEVVTDCSWTVKVQGAH